MLPRFHDSSFFLQHLAFRILELCCLDSMFLVSFTAFEFCIPYSGIMLPRFYVPFSFYGMCILNYGIMLPWFHDSKFYLRHLHSAFWNYVASILCSFFPLRCLISAFPILELCCLDSMIIDYLHTVFGIQRIYYTVIMLPRFHRVRTRWPGNNLWARLKREKLEPISRIIWKKSPSKWV